MRKGIPLRAAQCLRLVMSMTAKDAFTGHRVPGRDYDGGLALGIYHRCMTMTALDQKGSASLTAAACLFHGFSDRARLVILQHLLLGEHRVVELTEQLGLAQSTVSKHLACLKDCGLISSRPEGRASVFSVTHPEATAALLTAAEQLLDLTGFAVTLCPNHGVSAHV